MPTVHTTDDETPPIFVILYDEAIEPDATVAPEGPVRFTVINQGEHANDFAVSRVASEPGASPADSSAGTHSIAPGEREDVAIELGAGRYLLEVVGASPADARAELTVQPAATYNATEGRGGGRTEGTP